jgi:uncharacterized membrane protein
MNMISLRRNALLFGATATLLASVVSPAFAAERWTHHHGGGGGHERHDWGGRGGGYGGGGYGGGGYGFGGALLGLGVGAALGAAIVAPPAYYAPPPVVYYGY